MLFLWSLIFPWVPSPHFSNVLFLIYVVHPCLVYFLSTVHEQAAFLSVLWPLCSVSLARQDLLRVLAPIVCWSEKNPCGFTCSVLCFSDEYLLVVLMVSCLWVCQLSLCFSCMATDTVRTCGSWNFVLWGSPHCVINFSYEFLFSCLVALSVFLRGDIGIYKNYVSTTDGTFLEFLYLNSIFPQIWILDQNMLNSIFFKHHWINNDHVP